MRATTWLAMGWMACASCAVGCGSSDPPAGAPSGPTYYEDIAPIVAEHCAGCHQAGGIAPFSLDRHEDALEVAEAIEVATRERTMPPWGVDNSGDCHTYEDARWLTDAQIETIAAWVNGDRAAGDPASAPAPAPLPKLQGATRSVEMASEYLPNPSVDDDYRCFVLDPLLDADAFLTAYEVVPGEARTVHHVLLFALSSPEADAEALALDEAEAGGGYTCFGGPGVGDFRFLAAWAPGTGATVYPEGTGLKVWSGRKTIMQVHYNLAAGPLPDRTRVDMVLEPSVAEEASVLPLAHLEMELPPGQASTSTTFETVVDDDVTASILGVYPHMHTLGRSLRVERDRAGQTTCVTSVPRWDFGWQRFYFYDGEPVDAQPGDVFRIRCDYSTQGRTEPVGWGEGTADEMCLAGFYFLP